MRINRTDIPPEAVDVGVGDRVVYIPRPSVREFGVITGFSPNGVWVFVKFDGDQHSKAVPPGKLLAE